MVHENHICMSAIQETLLRNKSDAHAAVVQIEMLNHSFMIEDGVAIEEGMSESTSILGCCVEYMKSLPDKAFDWAVVDPNYGLEGSSHRNNKSRSNLVQAKDYHNALWLQEIPHKNTSIRFLGYQ